MPRIVLSVSSVFLAVVGLVCLFLPGWVAAGLGHDTEPAAAIVPLAAAGPLGFAALNWTGRGAIYGGIYGRPIVLGNVIFGGLATLLLLSLQLDTPTTAGIAATAVFAGYWAVWTWLLIHPPFGRD